MKTVEDAEFFEEKPNYTVEWTAVGNLQSKYLEDYQSAKKALKELGYRKKQDIAKSLGIKANQSESDLDEQLEDFAEDLQRSMENQ